MSFLKSSLTAFVVLVNLPVWAAEPTGGAGAKPDAGGLPDPVAVVNDVPISQALVEAYLQLRRNQLENNQAIDINSLLNDLVDQELLLQEAGRQKLVEQDAQLALQLEITRRNLITTAAVRHILRSQPLDDATLQKEYERLAPTLAKKEYQARHILVDSENKARDLIKSLEEGADFSALAKSHSSDNSAQRGGDLGWVSADIMPEPFGQAVARLDQDAFTKQPVETRFGWHIIRLDDVRTTAAPSLEELRPRLVSELQERTIKDHLQTLREAARIDMKPFE